MNENPRRSTSKPSGTMISIPPQNAVATISTSGPSISAWRRSRVQPPITATALVRRPRRHLPFVTWPLMTATWERDAEPGAAGTTASKASVGRSRSASSSSARVLASSAAPIRSENSSSVSRPATTCSRSSTTVRSRSASATRSDGVAAGTCGGGSDAGWSDMLPVCRAVAPRAGNGMPGIA